MPLIGNVRDDQIALVKLPHETLNLFERYLLRGEFGLKLFLNRFERFRAVEVLENEIFFVLETKILHPYRILDDPVGTPEIIRPLGGKIGADPRCKDTLRARNQTVR